jgi:SanA protein
MVYTEQPLIYRNVDQIPEKQAVLVLGSSVYMNTVTPVLQERLDQALAVYHAKKALKFIVSGDHGQKYYDEVNTMKKYLLDAGVPDSDIFMDHAGFSTYDSIYRARNVFGASSLVIASQGFHLPRALFIAKALGLDVVGIITDEGSLSASVRLWNAFREPFARVKAVIDVFLLPNPSQLAN